MSGETTPGSDLQARLAEHRPAIRRFLIARTGSDADADDLIQDLWVKVGTVAIDTIGNPRAYLFQMANNLVLDRLRAARRREIRNDRWSSETYDVRPGDEAHDGAKPADLAIIERERIERVHAAIAQLPTQAGRIVRLHKIEGKSHRAIADQLSISVSAVEKSMAVAMVHLRRLLEDLR